LHGSEELCDDQEVVREGLRAIVGTAPGLEVVGVAGDGAEDWPSSHERAEGESKWLGVRNDFRNWLLTAA
jgi:hypothetical protein